MCHACGSHVLAGAHLWPAIEAHEHTLVICTPCRLLLRLAIERLEFTANKELS